MQTAENLAAHGIIDAVVPAEALPELVDNALAILVDPPVEPALTPREPSDVPDEDSAWTAHRGAPGTPAGPGSGTCCGTAAPGPCGCAAPTRASATPR